MSKNDLEEARNPFGEDSADTSNVVEQMLALTASNEQNGRRIGRAIWFGGFVIGACLLLSGFSGRYTLVQQDGVLFRMDTWTGQVSCISGSPLKGSPFGELADPERLFKNGKWVDLPR